MPDFAKEAFDKAFVARCDAEGKAFNEMMDRQGQQLMMSAIALAGFHDMAKIFDAIRGMGLETVMHRYELTLMSLAFHEGTGANIE